MNARNHWVMAAAARSVENKARALTSESPETPEAPESAPVARVAPISVPSKRPFPVVRVVKDDAELAWEPEAMPLFSCADVSNLENGTTDGPSLAPLVRAGEAFAIVRPGWERWPLGIASDHYKVTSHVRGNAAILSACTDTIEPNGRVMAGHGYHVAYGYFVRHLQAASVDGARLMSKLIVAHDHTGMGALRAAMVLYLGGDERGRGADAIGAIVRSRGLHVASQPQIWQGNVDAMIERAILAQDAVIDLLRAASVRELAKEDREFFKRRGIVVRDSAVTALDAIKAYHRGYTRNTSWGVWERRLSDDAIRAVVVLLGASTYGAAIDAAMGTDRVLSCTQYKHAR